MKKLPKDIVQVIQSFVCDYPDYCDNCKVSFRRKIKIYRVRNYNAVKYYCNPCVRNIRKQQRRLVRKLVKGQQDVWAAMKIKQMLYRTEHDFHKIQEALLE